MAMRPARRAPVVPLLNAGTTFAVLTATSGDYGVTWDEAFPQFANALLQAEWFQNVGRLGNPLSEENVSEYWDTVRLYPDIQRSDHPSLPKTVMALSYLAFDPLLGTIRSLRVPNHLYFALLAGSLCFWTARRYSLLEGVGAASALVCMPRVFGHAHVAGLDLPVLVLWVLTALAYFDAIERPTPRRVAVCGLVYGIAACFKLHAFFFPVGFLLWALWDFGSVKAKGRGGPQQALAPRPFWRLHLLILGVMGACAAALYFATQPFLWHHTWERLAERFGHYAGKAASAPIPLYYLGESYEGKTPWHYPLVMTAATVPLPVLALILAGVLGGVRSGFDRFEKLALSCWLASVCLVLLPLAQAYDGVRLFLASFGFLSVLAGRGLGRLANRIRSHPSPGRLPDNFRIHAGPVLALLFLAWPALSLFTLHPFHLEYYSALVGGIPGAHRLGMESTYWCDALTPEFRETLNRAIPPGANLRPLSMSYEVLRFYQREDQLRPDIRIDNPGPKDFHLLQCRQGMMGDPNDRRFITGWDFYRGRLGPPIAVHGEDGVPFFILYGAIPGAN